MKPEYIIPHEKGILELAEKLVISEAAEKEDPEKYLVFFDDPGVAPTMIVGVIQFNHNRLRVHYYPIDRKSKKSVFATQINKKDDTVTKLPDTLRDKWLLLAKVGIAMRMYPDEYPEKVSHETVSDERHPPNGQPA